VKGLRARAEPVKFGEVYRFSGRDWVLLRLVPDADHHCLGENPDIGWARLSPLSTSEANEKSFAIAGYPSDRSQSVLWAQDACRLYEKSGDIEDDGMWTTDCATLPRASGSPIFFVENGMLNVVALMSGHLGNETSEVLPKWDPNRANLALDVGKIVSSDSDVMDLITHDIARFGRPQSRTGVSDR
jgi:V8-like Glu-specific endopeptidase